MKSIVGLLGWCCLLVLFAACDVHFMTDASYRAGVERDLEQKKLQMSVGDLFSVLQDPTLDVYEREALTFLYAYMPAADVIDYSGDFHLMNVRASRRAAEEMSWGSEIPEELFRHFVLPVRVNNEPLDSARVVFYEELKGRVANLSMYDAILEVNHWCHEKAVYMPSDARTSSPLATVRTAYGRCGEESTLLVAALRSVGIPARQVYTPRWAHTDDNHAWVEAWADGKWYFLGACEPEPVLNLGWFNAPASRGMLMHTKVFGRYVGDEEVMNRTATYTEINVIGNYAPVAKLTVSVVDADNHPVADALVEFKLYNYAEFYTVARKQSDVDGKAFLTAGKGDMLVWASKDGKFGFSKVSFGKDESLIVKLDKIAGDNYTLDWDLIPPPESVELPEVTLAQREKNNRRLAMEDSIRQQYTATFFSEAQARSFAQSYKLNEELTVKYLMASRGNHEVIRNFMARLRSDKSKKGGFDLLQQLSAKDLRDVPLSVLLDHMLSTVRTRADLYSRYVRNPRVSNETLTPYKAFFKTAINEQDRVLLDHMLSTVRTRADLYSRYVRNPRVSNETLTPYKAFFKTAINEQDRMAFQQDPLQLITWVKNHIRLDETCNLGACPITPAGVWKARMADNHSRPITPAGVWKARMADNHSRDIFFVALARSMGIPARIDEVTGKVQLLTEYDIIDVDLTDEQKLSSVKSAAKGRVVAAYRPIKTLERHH